MANSSVISPFQLGSYRIDKFELSTRDHLGDFFNKNIFATDNWQFKLGLKTPLFFENENAYVGGLGLMVRLVDPDVELADDDLEDEEKVFLTLESEITGVFKFEDKPNLTEAQQQALVKIQIPAILMPYLRSTITSFLANAGYGSVVLPMVNMKALAENEPDLEIITK